MMKLLFIPLLLLTSEMYGQTIFEFESGYYSRSTSITHYSKIVDDYKLISNLSKYNVYTDIKFGYAYKGATLYTTILNQFRAIKWNKYDPGQVEYTIGLKYSIKKFTMGYEHMCSHPVLSNTLTIGNVYRASYDKIYLRIKIL